MGGWVEGGRVSGWVERDHHFPIITYQCPYRHGSVGSPRPAGRAAACLDGVWFAGGALHWR